LQVDTLVDFASAQLASGAGLERACAALDAHLATRSLLVPAPAPTLADVAAWGALTSLPQWGKVRRAAPDLSRWHDFVAAQPALAEVAAAHAPRRPGAPAPPAAATAAAAANGRAPSSGGSFDVGLVGAVHGAVVTRFPPEPSGFLHIGHAKAALLNQEIADRHGGRMLVRFDDTNPTKERDEYVDSIVEDIGRLGLRYDRITYTSDYFPQLAECAERLIRAGHLYADDTPVERMREERMAGTPSARRDRPAAESLAAWAEMRAGSEEGRRCCLRLKLDHTAGNTTLRDPTAYRCNEARHWRTGDTYKVRRGCCGGGAMCGVCSGGFEARIFEIWGARARVCACGGSGRGSAVGSSRPTNAAPAAPHTPGGRLPPSNPKPC
jgi:glutamyl-tRNA synthetase